MTHSTCTTGKSQTSPGWRSLRYKTNSHVASPSSESISGRSNPRPVMQITAGRKQPTMATLRSDRQGPASASPMARVSTTALNRMTAFAPPAP